MELKLDNKFSLLDEDSTNNDRDIKQDLFNDYKHNKLIFNSNSVKALFKHELYSDSVTTEYIPKLFLDIYKKYCTVLYLKDLKEPNLTNFTYNKFIYYIIKRFVPNNIDNIKTFQYVDLCNNNLKKYENLHTKPVIFKSDIKNVLLVENIPDQILEKLDLYKSMKEEYDDNFIFDLKNIFYNKFMFVINNKFKIINMISKKYSNDYINICKYLGLYTKYFNSDLILKNYLKELIFNVHKYAVDYVKKYNSINISGEISRIDTNDGFYYTNNFNDYYDDTKWNSDNPGKENEVYINARCSFHYEEQKIDFVQLLFDKFSNFIKKLKLLKVSFDKDLFFVCNKYKYIFKKIFITEAENYPEQYDVNIVYTCSEMTNDK